MFLGWTASFHGRLQSGKTLFSLITEGQHGVPRNAASCFPALSALRQPLLRCFSSTNCAAHLSFPGDYGGGKRTIPTCLILQIFNILATRMNLTLEGIAIEAPVGTSMFASEASSGNFSHASNGSLDLANFVLNGSADAAGTLVWLTESRASIYTMSKMVYVVGFC